MHEDFPGTVSQSRSLLLLAVRIANLKTSTQRLYPPLARSLASAAADLTIRVRYLPFGAVESIAYHLQVEQLL